MAQAQQQDERAVYRAVHRYARIAPRKVREFATLVRGRAADEALEMLRFHHNRGARLLEKVIRSAMGNAEDRGVREPEELILEECRVDGGPIMKRIQPRARGTAYMILKRFSHIVVGLAEFVEGVDGGTDDGDADTEAQGEE